MQFLMRDTKPKILSSYRRVVHIGDLQGTLHPLLDPASPLANGIEDDVFYIFCGDLRSEEHTSELQSLMRISYAVFCLKKKNNIKYPHIRYKVCKSNNITTDTKK